MSWMDKCYLSDDGMPSGEMIAVEEADSSGERQSLWVRVGPVWYGEKRDLVPRIWICYQEEHMGSSLAGPVMLDPDVWEQLVKAVSWRLKRRRRKWSWRIFMRD